MERAKVGLFLAVLIAPAFLAGCNVKDWYNQEGFVQIGIKVDPGKNSSIGNFQSLTLAVYGVTLHQGDTATPKNFEFQGGPLVFDAVEKSKKNEVVPLTQFKTNMRATDRVNIRITVVEAVDASGAPMDLCRDNEVPAKYPCFYQSSDSALVYEDHPFSPPRGGTIVVGFPLSVGYATKGKAQEYFLFADPALISLDTQR